MIVVSAGPFRPYGTVSEVRTWRRPDARQQWHDVIRMTTDGPCLPFASSCPTPVVEELDSHAGVWSFLQGALDPSEERTVKRAFEHLQQVGAIDDLGSGDKKMYYY